MIGTRAAAAARLFWSLGRLVTYADPATAEAAIERLNNAELGGRPIHIRLDRKEVEASGGFPGEVFSFIMYFWKPYSDAYELRVDMELVFSTRRLYCYMYMQSVS